MTGEGGLPVVTPTFPTGNHTLLIKGQFGDITNPLIESNVAPDGSEAMFILLGDEDNVNNIACVENNVGVWKQTASFTVVGNAIKSYIDANFEIPGDGSIRYSGAVDNVNPPSQWETLN